MPGKELELPQVRRHTSIYKDDDYLSAAQAAEVLSENSGHTVSPRNMAQLVARGQLKHTKKFSRYYQYQYGELKDRIVSRFNAGPKPRVAK